MNDERRIVRWGFGLLNSVSEGTKIPNWPESTRQKYTTSSTVDLDFGDLREVNTQTTDTTRPTFSNSDRP